MRMKVEIVEFEDDALIEQNGGIPFVKIATCSCGEQHELTHIYSDFECGCRRKYNPMGQELESFFGNGDDQYWCEEEMQ